VHGERPAQGLDTVFQPEQPCAPHWVGAADTVVTYAHPERTAGGLRAHLDNRGARVLRRVGEHFRDDVVDAGFDWLGKPAIDPHVQFHRDGGAPPERAQRRAQPCLGQDRRVDATRDLPQVIDHAHELRGRVRHLGTQLATLGGRLRCHTELECQRHEALLCAVVQVPLDPPAGLVRCGDDPRAGGHELSPALRIRDRCRDQLGELGHPLLGVGRQWPLPGPVSDHSPQPAMDVDRHRDRGP